MHLLIDKTFTTSRPESYRVLRSIAVDENVENLKSYYAGYEKALDEVLQILEQHNSGREFVLSRLHNVDD
ncbi:MAG TPA: hypothetical protein VK497_06090 [Candidatus Saccharimonadales bacterium]|nr:hypothetical protein [Candidatus Saccharimonadales bacterium]